MIPSYRRFHPLALALGAVVALASGQELRAQTTATQTVTFEVQAINRISVSGDPSALVLSNATNTASAGSAPTVSATTTTWAVTTNQTNQKVTASLNSGMPAGLTLRLQLAAPTGASTSQVTLGTSAVDAVTGISQVNQGALNVTYTLEASATAGVVASQSRTVTLTIVAGA